jgi:hypothetical protein
MMEEQSLADLTAKLVEKLQNLATFLNKERMNDDDCNTIAALLGTRVLLPCHLGAFMTRAALDPQFSKSDLSAETLTVCESAGCYFAIEGAKLHDALPQKIRNNKDVSIILTDLFRWLTQVPKKSTELLYLESIFRNKLGRAGSSPEISKWLTNFRNFDERFRPVYEVRECQQLWMETIAAFRRSPFYQNNESAFHRKEDENVHEFQDRTIGELSRQWQIITKRDLEDEFERKKGEYSESFWKEHESELIEAQRKANAEVADFRDKYRDELEEVDPLVIPSLDSEIAQIDDLKRWIEENREKNRKRRMEMEVELSGDVKNHLRTNTETAKVFEEIEELGRKIQQDQTAIEFDQTQRDHDVSRIQELREEIKRKRQEHSEHIVRNQMGMKQLAESGVALVRHFGALAALNGPPLALHVIAQDGAGVRRFCDTVLTTLRRH